MNRLEALRAQMHKYKTDFYYVPSADPHSNEYVPDHWQRRRFISNFSGSAGDAMITLDTAYLWTDPRYYLQAEAELDSDAFQLIRATQHNNPLIEWIEQQNAGFRLGLDPKTITIRQAQRLQALISAKQAQLELIDDNLIDRIWEDQPPLPTSEIQLHEIQYSGQNSQEKLQKLRHTLKEHHVDAIVLTHLAEIAWLFNIRGNDINYNPLVIGSAIISDKTVQFFVEPKKINTHIEKYFAELGVDCLEPETFEIELTKFTGTVWLDPNSCNYWVETQLQSATIYYDASPIMHWKAIKNPVELQGMQDAHNYDAIAVIKFLYWLENHWRNGVTELTAAKKLEAIRRENWLCVDLSFNTISGFGPNGAIIHYAVDETSDLSIDDTSLYLVDSGGQYPMGTTDITRTIHLGSPTGEQRLHYTLVLKGHLALGHAKFPQGTRGEHLNVLARTALWQQGLDYGHGTGHGVGCYSCVHEFPPRISAGATAEPLQPNMVLSNEPGVYFKNKYGIRIENLCRVIELPIKSEYGPFLGFEDLTLVPYCRQLIDASLLNAVEIEAVNAYHQRVFSTIKPLISDSSLVEWLKQATAPLN